MFSVIRWWIRYFFSNAEERLEMLAFEEYIEWHEANFPELHGK